MMNTNTKAIAFKNFRRFQDFPMLQLGNITYMVGRNNSGKSTMVKALLLITDYLQNQLSDTFSFDNLALEDANIVTFGRAKNNASNEPSIIFNISLGNYQIEMSLSGNDEKTKAHVDYFSVKDEASGFVLNINHNKEEVNIIKKVVTTLEELDTSNELRNLENEILATQNKLDQLKSKTSKEGLQLSDALNKLKDRRNKIAHFSNEKDNQDAIEYNLTYPLKYQEYEIDDNDDNYPDYSGAYSSEEHEDELELFDGYVRTEDNEIKEIISTFIYYNNIAFKEQINKSNAKKEEITELYNNTTDLTKWVDVLIKKIEKELFYYIAANPSKQSALFYLRDKENALSQAIHNFYQLGILEGQEESVFVKQWMKVFEVGDSFKINFYAGEAYEFKVIKNNVETHLSDKGMGSLQAMTLILKIASLIRLNKKNKKQITVLVEEPELNLHPALQSKLTDLFHEVHTKYDFKFIVETHSEYIIRRSQLLTLERDYLSNQDLNPNPFTIFYFHKEEGPYQMVYNNKGKFNRDFGPGFYDEVGSLTLKMIKKLRNNQTK